ncbi:MAG: glycine cleavage system protein GcvH [Deltaproteobacteria bacterium]|nr:glycine cleavage system protein GcvH [Deltaproteobacteria bacterium]
MDNDEVTIGICDYAQDQLGDVVFVELPQVGDTFDKGQEFGTVESVKAVSELFIPLSGEVTGVNENLEDTPELVNNEPYTGGWMIKIKPADVSEMDGLMMKDAYLDMLKG